MQRHKIMKTVPFKKNIGSEFLLNHNFSKKNELFPPTRQTVRLI